MIVAKLIATFFGALFNLEWDPDRDAAETYIGGGGAHVVQPQAILEHAQQGVGLDLVGKGQRVGLIVPVVRQRQRCFGVTCAKLEACWW